MNLDWVGTIWFIIYMLAAFRVTRLITRDSLPPIARLRDHVLDRWGHNPWSELIVCPWCMGFWVSAVTVVLASSPADPVLRWPATVFAASAIVGLLASRDD